MTRKFYLVYLCLIACSSSVPFPEVSSNAIDLPDMAVVVAPSSTLPVEWPSSPPEYDVPDWDFSGWMEIGCEDLDQESCLVPSLLGECSHGLRFCNDQHWSVCQWLVSPRAEICDGRDNNCNGRADEPLDGSSGFLMSRACYEGPSETQKIGECHSGMQFCMRAFDGTYDFNGPCVVQTLPSQEVCDRKDNDCDGEVDEEPLNSCGLCGPEPRELCNGLDDDCDGTIDEDAPGCECLGAPDVQISNEVCNNLDDDCDGRTDEAPNGGPLTQPCLTVEGQVSLLGPDEIPNLVGVCSAGVAVCQEYREGLDIRKGYLECLFAQGPSVERCNGLDDDCDGVVDNGFGEVVPEIVLGLIIDVSGSMQFEELMDAGLMILDAVAAIDQQGLTDRFCYVPMVIGANRGLTLWPPTTGCLPGIDPTQQEPDMISLFTPLSNGVLFFGQGGDENSLEALWNFSVDDKLDIDGDGIVEDIEWESSPNGIEGLIHIDIPLEKRVAVIIGDEQAQWSGEAIDDARQRTAQAMAAADVTLYLISPSQDPPGVGGVDIVASYGEAMENGFWIDFGDRGADSNVGEALASILQDAECLLGE